MYHGRGYNEYGNTYQQQSSWQQTQTDDDYLRETFQPRTYHQEHTNYPAYGGWQTTPNEDYYQVTRTEMVKTAESPMFPHLNTLIDETIRVERNNSYHRPEKHVTKADKHVPKAHEKVHVKKQVHFVQSGKEDKKETTYDENVDMEADNFIKQKHKKFDLSKLLSMRSQ